MNPLLAHIRRRRPQRGHPFEDFRPRILVGAEFDQHANGVGVVLGRGPHERGLSLPALGRIDLGPVRGQGLDPAGVTGARGGHQGRLAFRRCGVGIGARLQQLLDDGRAAAGGRQRKWRDPVAIRGIDLGSRLDQQRDRLQVAGLRRIVQRSGAVHLRRIHTGAALKQQPQGLAIARFNGIDHARVGGGGRAQKDAAREERKA